jgi:HD superfamily phosphohydrolase
MCDVFGNTMCADLLDYLIRDSQGTGLQMIYDEKIFKFFFIGKDINNGEHRLALSIFDKRGDERFDVLSEILEIMQMRHALAERVYYHKTKAIATSMLISILNKQIKKLPKDSNPYENEDSILNFTDSKLFEYLEGICSNDLKQAELLSMIKNRRLYKVGAIITARSAENLDLNISENFVRPYHDDEDYKEKEKMLNEKIQMKNKVMIYCPPEHPQAKEIQTFIQTRDKTRVAPLNQVKHDLTIKQQVNFLSKEKYKNLWKFFLFLHPDDSKNEIIVSKIITKFCKCLLIDDQLSKNLIRDKDFIKHSKYQPLTKLRGDLLDEWKEKKDGELAKNIPKPTLASFTSEKCSIIYPKIFIGMKDIVSDDTNWKNYEKSEFTEKEEYFNAFDMIWWKLFIEKPKREMDAANCRKLDAVGGAVDRIRGYQENLIRGAATSRVGKTFGEGVREMEKVIIDKIIEG